MHERTDITMTEPDLPALHPEYLERVNLARLEPQPRVDLPPRILLLYGSLRSRSFRRLLVLGQIDRTFYRDGLEPIKRTP